MGQITVAELAVLLVEPSPTQQKVIQKDLCDLGITKFEWSQTASDALDRMRHALPDLVISAMHLPDMTGTELVQSMRDSKEMRDVPFMLISSETHTRYLEPLRQAGVTAILPKPYDRDSLKRALYTTVDFLEPSSEGLEDLRVDELRVLIVDDSVTSRHHIKRLFLGLGVTDVVEANNGKHAVKLLDEDYFDLVVTDYNMPEMDGRELTEFIRQRSRQMAIPVLMITSEADQQRLASVEQVGVSALCDKPFEPSVIRRVLRTALLSTA